MPKNNNIDKIVLEKELTLLATFKKMHFDHNYQKASINELMINYIHGIDFKQDMLLEKDQFDDSLLITVIILGYDQIAKAIIEHEYCNEQVLSLFSVKNITALFAAASHGHNEIVQSILNSQGFSENLLYLADIFGNSCLMVAVQKNHFAVAKNIITHPCCTKKLLQWQSNTKDTVFIWAAIRGAQEIIDTLFNSPVFSEDMLHLTDHNKNNFLMAAMYSNQSDMVLKFLSHPLCTKALFEYKNKTNETILMCAASLGYRSIVKALLSHQYCSQEFIAFQDDRQLSALFFAIDGMHQPIAIDILKSPQFTAGILQQRSNVGFTPLLLSTFNLTKYVTKAILNHTLCDHTVIRQQTIEGGISALMIAVMSGYRGMVNTILKNKHCNQSVIELKDNQGRDALSLCIHSENHSEEIEALITMASIIRSSLDNFINGMIKKAPYRKLNELRSRLIDLSKKDEMGMIHQEFKANIIHQLSQYSLDFFLNKPVEALDDFVDNAYEFQLSDPTKYLSKIDIKRGKHVNILQKTHSCPSLFFQTEKLPDDEIYEPHNKISASI